MPLSLEYVAGLFDGEGWCRVQTPGMNTDGIQTSGSLKRDFPWHVTSRKAKEFLSLIVPHLVIKRDQVELALQLQTHIDDNNSKMRHSSLEFRAGIAAHRKSIADKITRLKKVNFNLPDNHGASPYRF